METTQLQLQSHILERIRQLAASRNCTPEQLIEEIVEQIRIEKSSNDSILGMFADEPELIDQVLADAMKAREQHPLRTFDG